MKWPLMAAAALAVPACRSAAIENRIDVNSENEGEALETGAGDLQSSSLTIEGRISEGVECPIVTTPDGDVYSIALGEADFGPGDYVKVQGELADTSTCMQGKGHLAPERIVEQSPPARDRDPARAGGVKLTLGYLLGSWTAKGGNCEKPNFDVTDNGRDMAIIETRINGYPETGVISYGPDPRMIWDDPLPDLPVETRGPDGLAVMPAPGEETVTLAGHRIEGDGVVFIKCA